MNKHNKLNINDLSNMERVALALMPLGWEIIHQDDTSLKAKDQENDWLFEDSLLKVWYAYGEYHFALTYSDATGITDTLAGQADDLRDIIALICDVNTDDFERTPESSHDFEPLDTDDDNFAALATDFHAGVEALRHAIQKVSQEEDERGIEWLKEDAGFSAWPPGTIARIAGIPLKNDLITPDPAKVFRAGPLDEFGYASFPNHAVIPPKPITLSECINEVDPDDMTEEELREFIRLGFFKR